MIITPEKPTPPTDDDNDYVAHGEGTAWIQIGPAVLWIRRNNGRIIVEIFKHGDEFEDSLDCASVEEADIP